jgi:hypothetical protein
VIRAIWLVQRRKRYWDGRRWATAPWLNVSVEYSKSAAKAVLAVIPTVDEARAIPFVRASLAKEVGR